MKKKILKNVAILTFALFGLGIIGNNVFNSSNDLNASPVSVSIGTSISDIWTHNYCRCYSGECKSGRALSIRRSCAKSEDPIDCSHEDYENNC